MILYPEEILKTQICSCCKKYLSYGPIEVSILEGVKCGRCVRNKEVTTPSLLDNIIEYVIFPCVNRFDGCNELLKCEDVAQHENGCKGSLYSCPICVNLSNMQPVEYSLLSLIHHYEIFHSQYYLTKPLLSINTNSAKEYYFLYCNEYKNILALINVKCIAGEPFVKIVALGNNKDKIVCKCHTVSRDVILRQRSSSSLNGESHFELLSATDSDNSSDKMCLELELSLLCITTPSISLEESKFKYSSVIKTKIKPEDFKYSGQLYDDFMLKRMPDFCLNQDEYSNLKKIQKNSVNGKINVLLDRPIEYRVMCQFCENYFFLSDAWYKHHNNPLISFCVCCYNIGVKFCHLCPAGKCIRHENTIFKDMSNLLFYCRYQCGIGFRDNAVFDHEKTCTYNQKAALSDSQFAKFYFGDYFIDGSNKCKSIVIRNDNRVTFDMHFFWPPQGQGRIYMVTDSGFCCIIFYKVDKSDINFSVAHKYPLDKFYTLFKIVVDDENQPFREERDSFNVSLQTRKLFFVVAPREYEKKSRYLNTEVLFIKEVQQ